MTRKRKRRKNYSVLRGLNEVNTQVAKSTNISVVMVIIILIAGLMIGFVWQKVKIVQLVDQIGDLHKQEQVLKERNEKKRVKVLSLLNDSRIIKIAEHDLKMVLIDYEKIYLPDDFRSQEKMINAMFSNEN